MLAEIFMRRILSVGECTGQAVSVTGRLNLMV